MQKIKLRYVFDNTEFYYEVSHNMKTINDGSLSESDMEDLKEQCWEEAFNAFEKWRT